MDNKDPWFSVSTLLGVNMKGCDLEASQMSGVNLRVATMKGANLQNCNLRGAILAGADLEVTLRTNIFMHHIQSTFLRRDFLTTNQQTI